MSNSPRYIGFIEPPYVRTFTDLVSGAALDLTGCVSSNFTLTMLNAGQSRQGAGVWTVLNQTTNKGQASYQWTLDDVATSGFWEIYTTVKLPSEPAPREMDPEVIHFLAGTVGAGAAPAGVLPSPAASLPFLNIRDFGGIGDGLTDSTIPIYNARAAARALGGARICYGPGIFRSRNQDISNDKYVYHEGSGRGTTIIELMDGANTDLFSGQTNLINLAAAGNTGPIGTLTGFGFSNMTLDGNKANQSAPATNFTDTFQVNDIASYITNQAIDGGAPASWTLGGGTATSTGGSEGMLLYNGPKTIDGATTAILTQSDVAGLVARVVDHNNLYVVYIYDASANFGTPNTALMTKIVGGSYINLGSGSFAIPNFVRGTPHTFALSAVGTTISFSMDGTVVQSVTDSSITAAGNWGLDAGTHNAQICTSLTVPAGAPTIISYPLRFYGSDCIFDNFEIRNGYSGSLLSDWNASTWYPDSMEMQASNCKFHDSGGIGVELGGPHDSQFTNVLIFQDAIANLHLAPNCITPIFTNCHFWQNTGFGNYSIIDECYGASFVNCEAESAALVEVFTLGAMSWVGGKVFNGVASAPTGFQIGQHGGQTPLPGQVIVSGGLTVDNYASRCEIRTSIVGCTGPNGALYLAADGGGNIYDILFDMGTGTPIGGASSVNNLVRYNWYNNSAKYGAASTGMSFTPQVITTGGTVTFQGIVMQRLNPAGNVTGVIMPPGSLPGQEIVLVNISAFTITFAASGTSKVALGASLAIPANNKVLLYWDSLAQLWY